MSAYRYRITYGEQGDLRFSGHLDLNRALERTFRRADIPLAFSEGFNPRPRINIGQALPLGCTSAADLFDVWLAEELEPNRLIQRLQAAAPPGLLFIRVERIEQQAPKLQAQIRAADFEVRLPEVLWQAIGKRVAMLLECDQLYRVRRGKDYDLRPLIEELELRQDGVLWMRLAAGTGAVGRADEVLRALELESEAYVPCRTRLVLQSP